ncbi:neuroglian-like isoform X1 [Haliotis rubra]|uniref:neuroglian-like isoform X1 n=2 Tax=Haliotis rubra TaxID=36100 RepID=UPI001EE53424|nr:neuroglian-like isoform X1 [Haliotis rubra]
MRRAVLLCFILCCSGILAVTRPPGVYIQPRHDVFFKAGETVEMPCVAEGIPNPRYTWKKNGIDFNPSGNDDRMVQLANVGTIVINRPEDKDEGIFQCFAENDYGKSATININLREAKLKDFDVEKDVFVTPYLGESQTLNCVPPESIPPPEVYWVIKEQYGGFEPINFDARVTMDHESRLRFTNVKASDGQDGKAYACMAMNGIVRKNTQGARQFIQPRGSSEVQRVVTYMWASPSDHYGLRGDEFRIKCIFAGNPTPDVHWERVDGKPLPDHVKQSSFGQELVFSSLEDSDAGDYECWATNDQTPQRVQRTMSVNVKSRPYWIEEPQDVELGIGGTARFKCLAKADPSPDIYWFINSVAFGQANPNSRIKKISNDEVMVVNVTKEDAMVIQCNVTNKHGYIWGDVYLNVLSEAPTIMVPPAAQVVVAEGQSVNLTCRTTGKPDPQITWFKEGRQITGGRYRTLLNGDLHIEMVVLADAGNFFCAAENIYGSQNASGILMVRRKTQIEQRPLDLEVNAQTDAKFTCSGTTDPEEVQNLKIKWMKDNKDITANDQRMTTNNQDNSLTISGTIVRDSGTYTCIATNGLDQSFASAMLTVKDRPDAPVNTRIETCEQGNATIRWTPGSYNNAPVQYFIVQYNTTFSPDQWIYALKVASQKTSANITLSPYANYTFRVLAYNKIGESDPSFPTVKICRTNPARPLHHPENLRTIGDRKGELHIEWTTMPQIQQNGPGFQYILQFKRQGDPDSLMQTKPIDDWTVDHFLYATSDVYRPYEITLKAKNSMGEAQQDAVLFTGYSGEEIPGIVPTDLQATQIEDTTAILSWNFDMSVVGVEATSINGEFKGFKVQVWRRNLRETTMREWDIGPEEVEANRVGNQIFATVDNLLPYTYLEARVAVMNNYYVGRPTDIIQFRTDEGVPGPVEFFKFRNIGDNHFNLEWGSPMDENGEIIGYDIGYQIVSGLDLGKMQDREPQINNRFQTSEILSGLLPSTKYRVYIWARTSIGRGDGYFIELTTSKAGSPEAPRYTIANIGETNINVTWWVNPYARSGTVIFVEYRKEGAPEWQRSTDEVVNTFKNITDLESGTTYDIRVVATNGKQRTESYIEKVTTLGVAAASALIGNIGWFIGMLVALLVLIALVILAYCLIKRGFEMGGKGSPDRGGRYPEATYTGIRVSGKDTSDSEHEPYTSRIPDRSSDFGPEPRGYNNDYYDDRDRDSYYDYDRDADSMRKSQTSLNEKRPPSYYSDKDRYSGQYYDDDDDYNRDAYEDYDRKPSHRDDEKYDRDDDLRYSPSGKSPSGGKASSSFV